MYVLNLVVLDRHGNWLTTKHIGLFICILGYGYIFHCFSLSIQPSYAVKSVQHVVLLCSI